MGGWVGGLVGGLVGGWLGGWMGGWVGWWGSGWVDGQPCSPSANADGKNVDGDKPRQPKNDQASKREASRLTALARRAVAKPKPSAKAKAKQPCRC